METEQNTIQNKLQEDKAILQRARFEKDIEAIHESQSIMDYFAQVERAKKEFLKTHPDIPESDADLYL